MTNLTITVGEDVLRWAKVWAARQGTSVSRLVGEMLRERMLRDDAYGQAMEAYLSTPPSQLSDGTAYPPRATLYDRDAC
ncbi:CopG family transcriptional regulator [bacterium]|nr:CopG family transcriptional regulator [Chloroflexi bacterium CFX6]RIL09905.1 MAG: CopG family transcriptional regulator [bacterium]